MQTDLFADLLPPPAGRDYDHGEWTRRAAEIRALVAEMRPTALEPFARVLDARDQRLLIALREAGHFMRCSETGRWFCPALSRR